MFVRAACDPVGVVHPKLLKGKQILLALLFQICLTTRAS